MFKNLTGFLHFSNILENTILNDSIYSLKNKQTNKKTCTGNFIRILFGIGQEKKDAACYFHCSKF